MSRRLSHRHQCCSSFLCLALLILAVVVPALAAPPAVETLTTDQRIEISQQRNHWNGEWQKLRDEGKLAEAAEAADKALGFERKLDVDDPAWLALSISTTAKVHEQAEEFAIARKLREEVLSIQIAIPGAKHWKVTDARLALDKTNLLEKLDPAQRRRLAEADSLSAKASDLSRQKKYAEAVESAHQAAEIVRTVLGENSRDYADSLNKLAHRYRSMSDYAHCEPLYLRVMEIRKLALGEDHPDYATSLNNLGLLYKDMGLYERAESPLVQAVQIDERALGKDHTSYATNLTNLASLYEAMDDFARAEPLYLQALDIRKRVQSDKHPDYASVLNSLGLLYKEMGDFHRSAFRIREAMEIRKRALGEKSAAYASSLSSMASLQRASGDFALAEPLYHQAMEIDDETFGKNSPAHATDLNSLAELYLYMGDDAKAEPLLLDALQIRKTVLGERHPDYTTSLIDLAWLYDDMGEYKRAEPLYEQVRQTRKEVLGENHLWYAISLNSLGCLYREMQEYAKAEPLLKQAAEIRKNKLGEKSPVYTCSLNNLALLYQDRGDYDLAEPIYRNVLRIRKEVLGDKHPWYATSLNNLAMLLVRMEKPQEAVGLAAEAVDITRTQLDSVADAQSERQQLAMNQSFRIYLDDFLTAMADAKSPGEDAYPAVLAWKGAITVRQRAIQRMREARNGQLDPRTDETFHQLAEKSEAMAQLSRIVPNPQDTDTYRSRLSQLQNDVETLQQKLAAASASYGRELQKKILTPHDLCRALPADAVLVDLLEYDHYAAPDNKGENAIWQKRLAAFVVRRDSPVERIELGPTAPIWHAIQVWRWRNTMHDSLTPNEQKSIDAVLAAWKIEQQDADPGDKLRQWVWDKLQPRLNGATTVLLSPDGTMAQFPWPALPGKAPGSYLLEDVALAVVPVPQLLPELLGDLESSHKESSVASNARPAPSLLVVGDVDFDADPGKAAANMFALSAARETRDGERGHWMPLPGTEAEMATIAEMFERQFSKAAKSELPGDEATKGAVVAGLVDHRYVHLATHGFFAPQDLKSALSMDLLRRSDGPELLSRQTIAGFQPGLLSGLVLAGANRPPSENHPDGILTALEVSQLDLGKVDLATLSACETGLGKTAGGEGMLGLQRAFQVAGARTVVATLWKIDDGASHSLMIDFYRNLWKKKLPKLEALRRAQLSMLREGASRGEKFLPEQPPDNSHRMPPYYWAAFVLSGDWR